MPTIQELPSATSVSAADDVLISQGGTARATSIGVLLASTQPSIVVGSQSLLGRTSVGAGSPEQVDVGLGIDISSGTLIADGLDHAGFVVTSTLSVETDLVVSNQGSPMLMQASLLRGLFSAGQNVAIDLNGVISTTATSANTDNVGSGSSIGGLQVVTVLAAQDLVAVNHAGANSAIAYSNFLGGVTIDQAQAAAPVGDSDTIWTAQGGNVMSSQTFSAISVWIANKIATYKTPVVEVIASINLDTTIHNGRILVCSQPLTLTPLTNNMGNGFQCRVINASTGNVTLGPGFVSSSGTLVLTPWQSATLCCVTYSRGTIAFAEMPTTASTIAPPGQVNGLLSSAITSSTVTVSWQIPTTGGAVSSYLVQFRLTGTTSWSGSATVIGLTTYQIAGLQPSTSYDVMVEALNTAGPGMASTTQSVVTTSAQLTLPAQIGGVAANPTSSNAIQLTWTAQSGNTAAASYTVQYRTTGSLIWTTATVGVVGAAATISGLQPATSYDFSVIGVNSTGAGPVSAIVTAVTLTGLQSVSSILWALTPAGPYSVGTGAIGVNAHVTPATSPIQFGFSLSASVRPINWTAATLVNSNFWGAYAPTPVTAGTWYAWAEGLDGSAATVSSSPFVVQ